MFIMTNRGWVRFGGPFVWSDQWAKDWLVKNNIKH